MKTIIENLANEAIKRELSYISEHEEIATILKPLEGMTINGRTLNTKRLGKFTLRHQYGMFYIVGENEHLIGYDSDPVIKLGDANSHGSGFYYYDNCHGNAARERIKQIENRDNDKMAELFTQIKDHFEALRTLFGDVERSNMGSFYNPLYYKILRDIYNDKDSLYKITLSDFYFIRK